jgi:hypothetical protein
MSDESRSTLGGSGPLQVLAPAARGQKSLAYASQLARGVRGAMHSAGLKTP